jgi:excinuclease UvrABC nuclease subunit
LALPDVGEVLVRNLAAARRAGRLRCQSDLRAIPGLGPQRLRRLLRYMAPLPQVCHPAHPTK